MSDVFIYRQGTLAAEQVSLAALAEAVGTPFYCYSAQAIEDAYRDFAAALEGLPATICYALKANGNLAVVATLARLGAGADVVSEGELRKALAAGVPAKKIVFAGVGKTPGEMAFALEAGILQFNVESLPELETLSRVAQAKGATATVGIRVNPDVDARTHRHISTGRTDHKFGIDIAQAPAIAAKARALPGIALEAVAVHIGSQLTEVAPYRAAFARVAELYRELRAQGIGLKRLDLGGGLGIAYRDEEPLAFADYASAVKEALAGIEAELIFEPGRRLVGAAGVLVTRVLYIKDGEAKRFAIVDAGMNDFIRPMLYDAHHEMLPVKQPAPGAGLAPVDVVGPICESTDRFAEGRALPPLKGHDLLAICSTGAYGAVMGSTYNGRLPAAEVLVRGADYEIVRPRPSYDEMLSQERLPRWLTQATSEPRRSAG